MRFDRDEYLLLSRRGSVPHTRGPGPPAWTDPTPRPVRGGRARVAQALATALTSTRTGRTALTDVQEHRHDG